MKISACCGAKIIGEDFCADCREHCDVEDDEDEDTARRGEEKG